MSLSNCTVGEDCVLHHGVAVGQDGFGFFFDAERAFPESRQPSLHLIISADVTAACCGDVAARL